MRSILAGFILALKSTSLFLPCVAIAEHSVARKWNELLLEAIRDDFARPTIHARNLFHTSIAMYDAWAAFDETASPFLLGRTVAGFNCPFEGFSPDEDVQADREQAISFAAYRLLTHRFAQSPGANASIGRFDSLFTSLGYDPRFTSTDYTSGPAGLGNYIARCLIEFGLQDGANEQNDYANTHYEPVNPPLIPELPGNPVIFFLNRWQPLTLDIFIDQAGKVHPLKTPEFLSAEWGRVVPFALSEDDLTIFERDGFDYWVYHDPGPPPELDRTGLGPTESEFMWGFALVAIWSSHLDPADQVLWDISPASTGNVRDFPETIDGLRSFYDFLEGGDRGSGYEVNPYTGLPYEPQMVPRADYARVLAEFWADGPDSETPPGHWFTILNYVSDHPLFEKRFGNQGGIMDDLEWDVKAYFAMAGAMHDAAVTAWGIKGWYDYIRPISAIRAMAKFGQSSDPAALSYSPDGLPLVEGYIEVVREGDDLAGFEGRNIGKIKLKSWKGPDYIDNPATDAAGVGWILANNWWPYQRPTFITPPFAGYISGHSTFSRAAAEVLTLLTGDPYFPGGMGEFRCPKNQFLVFEEGPSVDLTLQWATYRDASDQCSLSRIWGGIHPPADDIPGRKIGEKIGASAFRHATDYFTGNVVAVERVKFATSRLVPRLSVFPNPAIRGNKLTVELGQQRTDISLELYNLLGQRVYVEHAGQRGAQSTFTLKLDTGSLASGFYLLRVSGNAFQAVHRLQIIK